SCNSPSGSFTYSNGGNLPPGVSFNASSSVYSGVPTATGTYAFIWTCQGPFTLSVGANIIVGGMLSFTLKSRTVGVPYIVDTTPFTPNTPPLSFSVGGGTVPPGLSLNASTGRISGTPTIPGSFTFVFRQTDSTGSITNANYTIVIGAGVSVN